MLITTERKFNFLRISVGSEKRFNEYCVCVLNFCNVLKKDVNFDVAYNKFTVKKTWDHGKGQIDKNRTHGKWQLMWMRLLLRVSFSLSIIFRQTHKKSFFFSFQIYWSKNWVVFPHNLGDRTLAPTATQID